MSTNGIVVAIENDQVILKVVVGCDGHDGIAVDVACELLANNVTDVGKAYSIAQVYGFGCKDCRVVLNKTYLHYQGDEDYPIWYKSWYRETFDIVAVNPRIVGNRTTPWHAIVADYSARSVYVISATNHRLTLESWRNDGNDEEWERAIANALDAIEDIRKAASFDRG
jgi:hypothetical protein